MIVLTHRGAHILPEALDALSRTEWPADALEVVVIDNASTDGSGEIARAAGVRVHRMDENVGFPANNVELRPDEADVFVLLNDDVLVSPDWLAPLVDQLRSPAVGAVQPTMLFDQQFRLLRCDAAAEGERLVGADESGRDVLAELKVIGGLGTRGGPDDWTRPVTGPIRCWLPAGSDADLVSLTLLAADGTRRVVSGRLDTPTDIVQNAGIDMLDHGYGRDRLEWTPVADLDLGISDIAGFCGGAVAMSAAFLRAVGDFEPSLFLYYEDLDLSMRGQLAGWRYLHVPTSVVRHRHGTTVGLESPLHQFWTTRNRLVVLARLAPLDQVCAAWVDEARGMAWHARHAIAGDPTSKGYLDRRWPALVAAAKGTWAARGVRRRLRTQLPLRQPQPT